MVTNALETESHPITVHQTGWDIRDRLDYCLNQLLGYVLLDRTDRYAINHIGVYLARYAATILTYFDLKKPKG
jgi:hypothetical protein